MQRSASFNFFTLHSQNLLRLNLLVRTAKERERKRGMMSWPSWSRACDRDFKFSTILLWCRYLFCLVVVDLCFFSSFCLFTLTNMNMVWYPQFMQLNGNVLPVTSEVCLGSWLGIRLRRSANKSHSLDFARFRSWSHGSHGTVFSTRSIRLPSNLLQDFAECGAITRCSVPLNEDGNRAY